MPLPISALGTTLESPNIYNRVQSRMPLDALGKLLRNLVGHLKIQNPPK
jgi:hypothetical protein